MGISLQVDMSTTLLLGEKLYTQSPSLVFLRETLQNSIDAGSTCIDILAFSDSAGYSIEVIDNGEGIEDMQGYFLKLGGSHKNEGAIGGYGIAKLAIIGMAEWEIDSLEGRITREALLAGENIDPIFRRQGCRVYARSNKSSWGMRNSHLHFLKSCEFSPDLTVTYNHEVITPYATEKLTLGVSKISEIGAPTSTMIIRNQGLVQFMDSLYIEDDFVPAYVYDVVPECTPYDEEYPFTASREGLRGKELDRYQNIRKQIVEIHSEHKRVEEEIRSRLFSHESGFVRDSSCTDEDIIAYTHELTLWKKTVHNVLRIAGDEKHYGFGLTLREDIVGAFVSATDTFLCNPQNMDFRKSSLISLAIHEVTHTAHSGHYEDFANAQTNLTKQVLEEVILGGLI